MTFDADARNANLRAWREANPERYAAQRAREMNARRRRRAAAKHAEAAALGAAPTARCNCKAGRDLPHLEFCPKFRSPSASQKKAP